MNGWRKWAVVAVLMTMAAGCSKQPAASQSNGGGPAKAMPAEIVIGVVGPETGGSAQLGIGQRNGVQMAVDEINAAGGVQGSKLKPVFEDDEGSPTKGANAVNKLLYQDKVSAIVGAVNSSVSLATRGVTDKAKIPQLTVATGSAVNAPEFKWIFMTALSDRDQAKALINYGAGELKYKKVGFLTAADDYGESGRKLLEEAAKAKGLAIAGQEKFNNNDKDYKSQLLKLQSAGAEGIYLWGIYSDGALILRQARELGVKAQFFAGSGMASGKLIELAGAGAEGFFLSQAFWPTTESPKVAAFLTGYKTRFKIDAIPHAVQSYDTVYVLADALRRAGTTDPEKLREALSATKELQTLTGKLSFDAINIVQGKTVFLTTVKNGQFALVKSGI